MASEIRFWFGFLYIGSSRFGVLHRMFGFGAGPEDASNGDQQCEIIPFPSARTAGGRAPLAAGASLARPVVRPVWSGLRRGAEMVWSHPRTRGAFVIQRLVAITLAVTMASLFDRMFQ